MENKKTVGSKVKELVEEALGLYHYFLNDKDKELSKKAVNLAKHDLVIEKLIATMALEKLELCLKKLHNGEKLSGYEEDSIKGIDLKGVL